MTVNNNHEDLTLGELNRRVNANSEDINRINEKMANMSEGSVRMNAVMDQMIEDRRDSKKTNEKIFTILDKFSTAFVKIEQEMGLMKQFREDSATRQDKIEEEVEELKLSPARLALKDKIEGRKQKINIAIAVATTIIGAVLLHFMFLL